jgi:hypothetical protein
MLVTSTRSRRRITFTAVAGLSVACATLLTACAPGGSSASSASSSQPASTAAGNAKVTITVEEA